jgi:hypothetical protein
MVMALRDRRRARHVRGADSDVIVRDVFGLDYASRLAAKGPLAGVWNGAGSEALGLSGTVENTPMLDAMLAARGGADVVMAVDAALSREMAEAARFAADLRARGRARDAMDGELMVIDALAAEAEGADPRLMTRTLLGWPEADYVAASYIHQVARCFPGADPDLLHTHTLIVREPVPARVPAVR